MTTYIKAIVGALVAAATYLIGIIPASGGFTDVTTVGWLGLVPVLAAAFSVVYAAPKNTEPAATPAKPARRINRED